MTNRTLALCCLLLALTFLVACGGGGGGGADVNPTAATPQNVGVVRGQITGDGDLSNIPVYLVSVDATIPPANIRADLTSETNGQLNVAFTNAAGEFVFNNIPYGMYNLMAKKDRNTGVIQRNISVSASIQSSIDLILKLTATGEIKGQISVPSGFPQTGVIAFVAGTSYSAFTDATGNFTISSVPVGTYTVMFFASGLNQGKVEGVSVSGGQTATIPLVSLSATNNSVLPASIVCGGNFSMVLTSNGMVYNWGCNSRGQLADGTTTNRHLPALVQGLSGVAMIAAGNEHALFSKGDITFWVVGGNQFCQLGDDTTVDKSRIRQIFPFEWLSGGAVFSYSVFCGFNQGFVNFDGSGIKSVIGWGNNANNQLGDFPVGLVATPTTLNNLAFYPSGGNLHTTITQYAGVVVSVGDNSKGQLGNGTWVNSNTPVEVGPGFRGQAKSFFNHSLATKADATIWAWGENTFGQIGDGTTTNRNVPTQVSGLSGVVDFAPGGGHSLAIKNDGTVWAWGNNTNGQLGDGTNNNRTTPVQVSGLSNVMAVAAGMNHSLALKGDGTIWAWGDNSSGQLGDGTTTSRNTPVKVQF